MDLFESSQQTHNGWESPEPQLIAPGVYGMKIVMVNVYLVGTADNWVLVDAGLYGSANRIRKAAERVFGPEARPKAILLTHGHFDHVGALKDLADGWQVPVYAHLLELPYLTGRSSYPPPDSTVGGGAMAALAWMYPKKPIDVSSWVQPLPEDKSVPGLAADWKWVHTPGHTPGHVSFFRESDRTLIVGDAFVTTKQESATAVISQKQELHGPPAYFTPDWVAAQRSLAVLADLEPAVAATGHGFPMYGPALLAGLRELVLNFEIEAVPAKGRYVHQPAVADETGVVSVPPDQGPGMPTLLGALGLVALAGTAVFAFSNRDKKGKHQGIKPGKVSSKGTYIRSFSQKNYSRDRSDK